MKQNNYINFAFDIYLCGTSEKEQNKIILRLIRDKPTKKEWMWKYQDVDNDTPTRKEGNVKKE